MAQPDRSKNKVYYFDSALSPQMVWLNLNQIDFRPDSGIRTIQIEGNDAVQGNVNAQLRPAAPITFLAPKPQGRVRCPDSASPV